MMEARKSCRMTQKQAASRSGLSLRTLTNLETGAVESNIATLYRLSIIYGLDFDLVQKTLASDLAEREKCHKSIEEAKR